MSLNAREQLVERGMHAFGELQQRFGAVDAEVMVGAIVDAVLASHDLLVLTDQLEQVINEEDVAISDVTGRPAFCNVEGMWEPLYRILSESPKEPR